MTRSLWGPKEKAGAAGVVEGSDVGALGEGVGSMAAATGRVSLLMGGGALAVGVGVGHEVTGKVVGRSAVASPTPLLPRVTFPPSAQTT
jgi:hypothetical protein